MFTPVPIDAFIQVRRGSSRLPDKAFLRLGERACIAEVIERLKLCRTLRRIVVCTSTLEEDSALVDAANDLEVDAFQGDLDDCLSRFTECARRFGSRVIVRVTGDSPLVPPDLLDDAVERFLEQDCDYLGSKALPVGTYFEIFSLEALNKATSAAVDTSNSADLTYFIGRTEINRVCQFEPPPEYARDDVVLALNRPEDLDVLRQVFEQAPREGSLVSLRDALTFLDANPQLKALNSSYEPVTGPASVKLDPGRLR